jgi:FkbM family methyltransferase
MMGRNSGAGLPATVPLALERLWLRALSAVTRDYLCVSVDRFRVYGSSQHRRLLYWLLKGSYERYTRKLFEDALAPGMSVVDLGAHIGYYTLLAADAIGSTGRVYAFECDPDNARFLSHNVTLNGFADRVTIVPKAAANRSGVTRCFADKKNSLRSSLVIERPDARAIDVECTTVDETLGSDETIDVVKVDVEGLELDAIRGMEYTIARAKKVVMFVECCPHALAMAGGSVAELLRLLDGHEFRVHVIRERERNLETDLDEVFAAERAGDPRYYVNLYCTKGS